MRLEPCLEQGSSGYRHRLECKRMGNFTSNPLNVTFAAGINLICTSIHRVLTRIFEAHVRDGQAYIEELFLQVDNCVGESKNYTLISYLGSLVGRGVIGRVEINSMIVGHTHIKIDRVFSRRVLCGQPDLHPDLNVLFHHASHGRST